MPPELVLPPITEVKHRLDGSRVEFECQVCLLKPGRHAVVVYFIDHDWYISQLDILIPAGSISTGFFWQTKPYNLYHWMTPAGETLGDYFNLAAETTIQPAKIEWLDLVLDYGLVPGKAGIWLDEDELPAELPPSLLRQIDLGRRELLSRSSRLAAWAEAISRGYLERIGLMA